MSDVLVVDTAPIIILAKAGFLNLLTDLGSEILLPNQVVREIMQGDTSDPARQVVKAGWGTRVAVNYIPVAVRSVGLLHVGEQAVLALALKRVGCLVVTDDEAAKKAAKRLGLRAIGTLGVIMLARQQGRIAGVSPVFHAVRAAKLYASDDLYRTLAHSVGETWP